MPPDDLRRIYVHVQTDPGGIDGRITASLNAPLRQGGITNIYSVTVTSSIYRTGVG